MKYQILFDYGLEGWKFEEQEFDTVDEAVKHAIRTCMSAPFEIVIIVNWEAIKRETKP